MIFKTKLIDVNKSYNFSDYFNLRIKRDKLLAFFGYFIKNELQIFKDIEPFHSIKDLSNNIMIMRQRIIFDSEIARREFLIAPLISKLMQEFECLNVSIEEKIEYNNLLKGKLDYLLSTENNILVLEAKNENIESALNQLFVEMITVDKLSQEENIQVEFIYGVVSTGVEWKFVILDRERKEFILDLKSYFLPDDLEIIMGIFVQILDLKK